MPIQSLLRRSSSIEDFEVILELLRKPALIWNLNKGTLEACNSEFIKFSGYSRKEIHELEITDLFPSQVQVDWNASPAPSTIQLANSIQVEIQSEVKPFQAEKHLGIISIQAQVNIEEGTPSHQINWKAIDLLMRAPLSPSLKSALTDCLKAGQILTDCDHLALYLPIPGSESKLIQIDTLGEVEFLPSIVHVDEISHLKIPVVWTLGTHTPSILHQSALTAHQSFQATCPLDPASPLNGLLTLGGQHSPPPHNRPPIIPIFCRTIIPS